MAANPRVSNGARRRTRRGELLHQADRLTCPWPACPWPDEPFDRTLHHLDPRAPEVDEIVPISQGGSPTERANTRLMHRWCNQQRGNGSKDPKPPAPRVIASAGW